MSARFILSMYYALTNCFESIKIVIVFKDLRVESVSDELKLFQTDVIWR